MSRILLFLDMLSIIAIVYLAKELAAIIISYWDTRDVTFVAIGIDTILLFAVAVSWLIS